MVAGVRVLSSSSSHSFISSGDLVVYYWQDEVSVTSVKETRAIQLAMNQAHPEGVYVLACIAPNTKATQEARTAGALIDRECSYGVRGHATVLPGQGFWVAAARSVLGAVFLISQPNYPRRVFAVPQLALSWFSSLGSHHSGDAVLAHIRSLERVAQVNSEPGR
jgi:hypothetical protein